MEIVADVLDHFPLEKIRRGQEIAIKEVEKAFRDGFQTVVLEAPVGSGKSAIAMTLASFYGKSHILTPRKSLQDQYFDDFSDQLVLMKGRSSYPCYPNPNSSHWALRRMSEKAPVEPGYDRAISIISKGQNPKFLGLSCAEGPCKRDKGPDKKIYKSCTEDGDRPCPYKLAVEYASSNDHIVHNLHSFIYQAAFAGWFAEREIMIVDEAHDMEDIVRDLITKKVRIPHLLSAEKIELPSPTDSIETWVEFLQKPEIAPKEKTDAREEYDEILAEMLEMKLSNFVVDVDEEIEYNSTKLVFTPKGLGNAVEAFILRYGKRRLLMSGTIYDKASFCRDIGINPDETYFARIDSSFPIKSRPIKGKSSLMLNTGYANYRENFPKMIENIKYIMEVYKDVKGLVHASSYTMADEIAKALNSERVMIHTPKNFLTVLNDFVVDKGNAVLISPTCQQGVDLRHDRARFQVIVRVPYMSVSSSFVKTMSEENPAWYKRKALVVFGQMIGRVMRSEDDWGHTILLDSRFKKFLREHERKLPRDVVQSIEWS